MFVQKLIEEDGAGFLAYLTGACIKDLCTNPAYTNKINLVSFKQLLNIQ